MNNTIMLINVLLGITSLVGELATTTKKITSLLETVKKEDRDVTDEELYEFVSARVASERRLDTLLGTREGN